MDLKAIAIILLIVACAFGENEVEQEEQDFSVILGDENFKETISTNNFFIMFYAPWCSHCNHLKPTWNELAELLNTQDESRVKIAKVNCVENHKTCSENEVTGYPTLKFFKIEGGEAIKYRSARDLPSFTQFINDQLGSSVDEEVAGGDKEEVAVPPPQKGLVELNDKNFNELTATGNWFIKFYAPWCGHCKRLAPIWEELGTTLEHDNSVNIGKIDCTEHRLLCKEFEVKGYPTLLWLQDGKKVDRYSGPRTIEDFKAYIEQRTNLKKDGDEDEKEEVKKDIVEDGEGGAVVQMSGDNFHQIIEKDLTFVALTASWCGHCKRMAGAWQQLAEKFVGDEKVKIGKIDCSIEENRAVCNEQEVNGYPTLFIYKNGKKISEYNGSRSLEDMHDFVKSHMSDELPRDEL